jgi:fused signal recognition particle receptor
MIIGIVVLVALVIAAVVAAVLVDRSHKRRATGAHDDSPSRTRSAQQPEAAAPATVQSSSEASKQQTAQSAGAQPPASAAPAASAPQQATTESAVSPTAQSASPTPAERPVETPESAGSRIVRLKAKLAKSSNPFGRALFNILAKDHLSETDWEDVEDTLLLADVGADASAQLVEELRNDARVTGASDPAQVRDALRSKLLDLVGTDTDRRLNADKNAASSDTANPDAAQPESPQPSVIIMVGVNGTGKTTTAGKLARLFVAEDKKVVMGAADTFRAAAADQLETWGAKVGVSVVRSDKDGADPASVAFDAAQQAKDANADVLIIDTAGRLQNKANLMNELGKIRRVAEKVLPVDEVLLVLDATTGQNGMAQAKVFAEAIGITGVVLSKLDGSAKGGIVVAVQKELGVPVKLVGLGEGPDDLAPFDAAAFVDGILA